MTVVRTVVVSHNEQSVPSPGLVGEGVTVEPPSSPPPPPGPSPGLVDDGKTTGGVAEPPPPPGPSDPGALGDGDTIGTVELG
jgi:hypothetical protein